MNDVVSAASDNVRLDKWLWAARFYKTRGLAREMIDGGKVEVDGHRARPAKSVRVGMLIRLRQGVDDRQVEVLALADKRGNASQAALLYQETAASIAAREQRSSQRRLIGTAPAQRPDKKDRRALDRLRRQNH